METALSSDYTLNLRKIAMSITRSEGLMRKMKKELIGRGLIVAIGVLGFMNQSEALPISSCLDYYNQIASCSKTLSELRQQGGYQMGECGSYTQWADGSGAFCISGR